jgi:predicted nucleic acid-binding Zn ribbon protein
MKKIGDILSAFFDKDTLEKAKGYGDLFSSWGSLTAKCGIPQVAAHSRITGLEKSLLLVEADHPGWVQILQTKQKELLTEVQKRFPGFFTTGIVLRLGRAQAVPETADTASEPRPEHNKPREKIPENTEERPWTGDERLKTALEKLKKSIT